MQLAADCLHHRMVGELKALNTYNKGRFVKHGLGRYWTLPPEGRVMREKTTNRHIVV